MEQEFYTGRKLYLLYLGLGLGTFIQVLDTSIANVAIPYIAGNLSVSPDEGTWVITSFAASNAVVLPLTGWLSDYFGRVRLFIWSVILFSITSFLCGFAGSLTSLVIYRVLQGAVAGTLIPLSQSLLLINSPPEKRGSALGLWAMVVIVAPVVGPIMGGYLTEVYSWPWIFFINVPLGFLSALIVWQLLGERESEIMRHPIDWVGLFFLCVAVATLQIMLDKGKDLDWFESNIIITLTIVSAISLLLFVVWNYFEEYPIVDFSFFKDRNFTLGMIVLTLGFLIYFGSTVIIPLWLQTEQNYTAYWAGVAVAPIGILPVLLSPYVGKHMGNFDLRKIASLSFAIFSSTFFYFAMFTTDIDLRTIMLSRLFQGIAITFFFVPLTQLSLSNIDASRFASATGLLNFVRILVGSGFGTSLSIELWSRLAIFHHARLTESVTIYRPVTQESYRMLNQAGYNTDVAHGIYDQLITQQAYMLSTDDLFWMSAWLFLVMIPIPFLCKRAKPLVGAHVAAE
jgi:DHA2 family multidrug resistance protein